MFNKIEHEESDATRDGGSMHLELKRTLLQKVQRCLLAFGAITAATSVIAHAENLDQGKSGARLFADSCVTCHHSARALAKGRFRLTLYLFLQQHYVSNSSAAWELTSYLESVDSAPRDRHPAAAKTSLSATGASETSLRPPMPIPRR